MIFALAPFEISGYSIRQHIDLNAPDDEAFDLVVSMAAGVTDAARAAEKFANWYG